MEFKTCSMPKSLNLLPLYIRVQKNNENSYNLLIVFFFQLEVTKCKASDLELSVIASWDF